MASNDRAFTLIETLVVTGILVTAFVAVASVFAVSIRTNMENRAKNTAVVLASQKIEELRSAALTDARWTAGGSAEPQEAQAGYFDYASVSPNGTFSVSTTDSTLPYSRFWQVSADVPKSVVVTVCLYRAELFRETWVTSPHF